MSSTIDKFRELRAAHLDPVVTALGLCVGNVEEYEMHGFAEAVSENVCVRFEHDRGLCEFALSSTANSNRMWSISIVASLFPRVRLLPDGEQRLTLTEQRQLIQSHWVELQSLFAAPNIGTTMVKLQTENDRRLIVIGKKTANQPIEPTR